LSIFKQIAKPFIILFGKRVEKRHFSGEPIIIGACPRSGTTLLLAILGAHSNIFAIPKQTYAFDDWLEFSKPGSVKQKYQPSRIDRLYLQFLIRRIPKGVNRWLEKTPKHIQSFDKILDYFDGKVKLINMFRDGRAVVCSKHPVHSPERYWVSVERWINDVNIGIGLDGNQQVLNVKYEDLVGDFKNTISRIYDFIGEEKPVKLDDWIMHTNIKQSKHWAAPIQNLYSDAAERWREAEHKERIEYFMNNKEAVKLLKQLGYPE
jgi:hypothetical protein